jgi:hypothetical protein
MRALVYLIGLLALASALFAARANADPYDPADWTPSVWSDKADYSPGELVTLAGKYWTPGEQVKIVVNDDAGAVWRHETEVVADADGAIADSFDLPDAFVALYSVTATGDSGAVATTSFTDGNVKAKAGSAGTTFTLTKTVYGNGTCDGSGTETTVTGVDTTGSTVGGLGSNESVKLQAAATSDQGGSFTGWTSADGFTDEGPRTICVRGFATGAHDFLAHYAADGTPPEITPVVTGTLGGDGWYTSDVTVSWTVGDPQSAIISTLGCGSTSVTSDQGSTTYTCTATSAGGTASKSVTVKRDATAPAVTVALARAADSDGWYNHAVGYGVTASSDALSGVASCDPDGIYTGPDAAGTTVTRSCTDRAGNTGSGSATLEYDATAPTGVSGAPDRAPDANGWYNHAVTVAFSGSDAMSGVAACTSVGYADPDGSGVTVPGTCADAAGNESAAVDSSSFDYDGTAPSLTPVITPSPVVLNGSATADPGASDATSGVASSSCDPVDSASVGAKSLVCRATDAAGNGTETNVGYRVGYATGGSCVGSPGHQILQPINADWATDLSVFKQGSTVPAKFRVCDANGASIGTAGVVSKFALVQRKTLESSMSVDEQVYSTTPDTAFRWSTTDRQWIFNIATKPLAAKATYLYDVTLDDGSVISFRFGLK